MADQITERDGVFCVRQPSWHGKETLLTEYPTRAEAQAIAHPWEPVREPVFRRVIDIENGVPVSRFEEVPEWQLAVRSDDGFNLGVVPESRVNISNSEMYDIAEAVEGAAEGEVQFETGGSLYGGKKVWLLLKLREPLKVSNDPNGTVVPYFSLQNGHSIDGGALRGQATLVRVVCDNTAQMADLDAKARGTEFVFKHTKNVRDRIEAAKEALAGWRTSVEEFNRLAELLSTQTVTVKQRELFVTEFVPLNPARIHSDRVVANVETARQAIRDILAGPTCEGIDLTAWGLVQASIEYSQHVRKAQTSDSRFQRAYLDRSALTADAVKLAREVAKV